MSFTRKHFTSGADYLRWLDTATPNYRYSASSYGCTIAQIDKGKDFIAHGNLEHADAIHELMTQFDTQIDMPTRVTRPNVRGHRVNMSAYLAGSPLNMMRRETELSEHTPIRVWVGTTSSIRISPATINKRGAALAAFALALSVKRQVTITPFMYEFNGERETSREAGKGALLSVDLSTSPLVVSELSAHLDVHGARYLGMYATHCADPDTRSCIPDKPESLMRYLLGAQPNDVYLGAIHIADPILRDPVEWINTNLAKYTNTEENVA